MPPHCEVRAREKKCLRDKHLELPSSAFEALWQGFHAEDGAKASPHGDMLQRIICKSLNLQGFSLSLVGDRRIGSREI